MVDAHALGACGLGRAGSNPASPHQVSGSDFPYQFSRRKRGLNAMVGRKSKKSTKVLIALSRVRVRPSSRCGGFQFDA